MANVSRTVDIIFNADDKVTTAVKNITASLDQLDRMAMKIVDPFAAVGKGILAADAALTGLAVGGMALSIKKSGEFNDAFAEISTLVDTTGANLEAFRGDILTYASSSSASIQKLNESIYQAISAGINYKDSIAFVAEAEKLSIAGRGDLEATTRVLASTLNAYGESVTAAADYSDIMFQTVKYGITTLPELADSFSTVTTIAAEAGIGFDEVAAAVATLTSAGLPTEKAMTSIRTAISNIIAPTEEAKAAAKTLGIQFDSNAVASKGFTTVMQEVFAATKGNVGAVSELFGNIRGLGAALVIGGDNAGRFATILDGMANRAGVVGVAMEKMENNFELVNQRFMNNLDIMLILIGTLLEQGYGKTVNAISEIFQAISASISKGTFNPVFEAFDQFGNRLSAFLKGLAAALPDALAKVDFSEFLDALDKIGVNVLRLFDGIDLTDPEDLAKVIQGIVNTITDLINISGGMITVFGNVFNLIRDGITQFSDLDDSSKETFGKLLAGAIVLQEAGVFLGAAILSLSEGSFKLQKSFEIIHDSIVSLYQGVQIVMDTWILSWGLFIDAFLWGANLITLGKVDAIKGAKEAVDEFVKGGWEDIKTRSGEIANAWNETTFTIKDASKTMTDDVKKVGEAIDESIPDSKIVQTGAVWDQLQAGILKENMEKSIPAKKEIDIAPVLKAKDVVDIKAKLEAEAKILEKSLELKAEIDIAQIEADTKRIEAAFESINVSIESTADVLSELFGLLAEGDLDIQTRWDIEAQIREENERREESLKLQKELTEAQIAALQARITAFQRGDPLITINAEGLEPHLEAIFFYILEQIQMRVNEEQQDFLLGINS